MRTSVAPSAFKFTYGVQICHGPCNITILFVCLTKLRHKIYYIILITRMVV